MEKLVFMQCTPTFTLVERFTGTFLRVAPMADA